MTKEQFMIIRKGDQVRLYWAEDEDQIIKEWDSNGMVTTYAEAYPDLEYVNHYTHIEYIGPKLTKKSENIKDQITSFFQEFREDCSQCPFRLECRNTYNLTRRHSTDAINLCDAITMNDKNYSIY